MAVSQIKVKFIARSLQDKVRQCFRECPLWSKSALQSLTQVPPSQLKFILPTVAYYFTNGPWRNQWVKFGYDPRKSKDSAMYQTLDYRVRLTGGARHKIKAKRNYANYLLPYKAMNWSRPRTSVINTDSFSNLSSTSKDKGPAEKKTKEDSGADADKDMYVFRPGHVPPCRQMFYQFKDLLVDEAQRVLADSVVAAEGAACDEKNGWFVAGTDQRLRDILTDSINRQLAQEGEEAMEEGGGGEMQAAEGEEATTMDEDDTGSSDSEDELP